MSTFSWDARCLKNKSQTSPNAFSRQKKSFANTVDTMFAKPRLVRQTGLEPVRQGHTPLKRACLPVPALPHICCVLKLSLFIISLLRQFVKCFFKKTFCFFLFLQKAIHIELSLLFPLQVVAAYLPCVPTSRPDAFHFRHFQALAGTKKQLQCFTF